jgi:hypothetical protein
MQNEVGFLQLSDEPTDGYTEEDAQLDDVLIDVFRVYSKNNRSQQWT